MNPRVDDSGFYQQLRTNTGLKSGYYRAYESADGFPIDLPPLRPGQRLVAMVAAASACKAPAESQNPPAPVGDVMLAKLFRVDETDGHMNVDNMALWTDSNGHSYCQPFTEPDEHVQPLLDHDLSRMAEYEGFPEIKSGRIDEYRPQLGPLAFEKSLRPDGKGSEA